MPCQKNALYQLTNKIGNIKVDNEVKINEACILKIPLLVHIRTSLLISINDLNGFQLRLVLESSFSQISLKG